MWFCVACVSQNTLRNNVKKRLTISCKLGLLIMQGARYLHSFVNLFLYCIEKEFTTLKLYLRINEVT